MSAVFAALVELLEAEAWPLELAEDGPALRTSFGGRHGRWDCHAEVRGDVVLFHSASPVDAHPGQLAAAYELVARINHGLPLGAVELDPETGEIDVRTSFDAAGAVPTPAQLRSLVHVNVLTLDRYLPAIRAVLDDGAEPAGAVAAVEQPDAR